MTQACDKIGIVMNFLATKTKCLSLPARKFADIVTLVCSSAHWSDKYEHVRNCFFNGESNASCSGSYTPSITRPASSRLPEGGGSGSEASSHKLTVPATVELPTTKFIHCTGNINCCEVN